MAKQRKNKTPIKIKCNEHGYFMMTPAHHINPNANGCNDCFLDNKKIGKDVFIEKSIKIFTIYKNIIFILLTSKSNHKNANNQ